MKRFSKVVALALLLAIVVSVFGILPAFAADGAETEYGTTVYNGTNSMGTIAGQTNSQPSYTTLKDANGYPYHKLAFNGKDPTGNNSDYINGVSVSTSSTSASHVYINDRMETVTNDDGSTTTRVMEGYEKNTDYFVVDFDISTDTTYIDGLYMNMQWYDKDWTHQGRYQNQSLYFTLRGDTNDNLYIGDYDDETTRYAYPSYTEDVWQHVTFVYDCTDTVNHEIVVYFYLNGVLSGTTSVVETNAIALYFIRWTTRIQTLDNASTNFANFTIKRFDVGYDGPFTGDRMLGHQGTTLDQMPDLAYCLENSLVTEATKYADVYDADENLRFTAYDWTDLDANLQDGDVVVLYKAMKHSLLVPENATITFKDAENHVITPGTYNDGDLVKIAKAPTTCDFSTITVVERQRSDYAIKGYGTDLSTVWDGDANYVYTILGDITGTIQGEGAAGRVTILDLNGYTATLKTNSGKHGVANGVKLRVSDGNLVWNGGGADFIMTNASTMLIFDDVNLTHNAGTFVDGRGGIVVFKNSTVVRNPYLSSEKNKTYSSGSLVSHKSDAYYYCSAMSVIVDNTDIDFTKGAPEGYTMAEHGHMFLMNAVSTGGIRYTGSRNYLTIRNGSELKMAGTSLIYARSYTGSDGALTIDKILDEGSTTDGRYDITSYTPTEAAVANKNENYINIIDSTISSSYQIVETSVELSSNRTVKKATEQNVVVGTEIDPETGEEVEVLSTVTWRADSYTIYPTAYDYDVEINVSGSDLRLGNSSIAYVARPSTISAALKDNFHYDVNLTVDGETKVSGAPSLVFREAGREVDMQISVADGVKLTTKNILRAGDNGASVVTTIGAGDSEIAYTSLGGDYGFIVTPTFDTYTYQLGNDEPVEFYWNKAEGEQFNINKVVTLDAGVADTYHYEWAIADKAYTSKLVPEFKPGANLTLNRDIALNLLIPATVNLDAVTTTVTDALGEEVNCILFTSPITKDGKDYYKLQIAGITPDKADEVYNVTVKVEGAYGEALSKTFEASPVQYAQDMLALDSTKDDAELVALLDALLNYFEAAYAYGGVAKDFTDAAVGDAAYGELPENGENNIVESYQLNLRSAFVWIITLKEGVTDASVAYTYNGEAQNTPINGGKVYVNLKACDILNDVTVTAGGESYTVNLATYVKELGEVDAKTSDLLVAMSVYAAAARAYQN